MADADSVIHLGDRLWVISQAEDIEAIVAFFGRRVEMTDEQWGNNTPNAELVSRRIPDYEIVASTARNSPTCACARNTASPSRA